METGKVTGVSRTAVGVAWMPLPVGAFFALNLRAEGKGFRSLLAALVTYAYAVRGPVAALMVAATTLRRTPQGSSGGWAG